MPSPADTPCAHAARERGIGIVELMVICVIVAILLAIGFVGISSSRKAGGFLSAVAVAQAYASAADDFSREHDGRYPLAPGTADWPGSGTEIQRGPMAEILGDVKYYLRSVPQPVQSGQVEVLAGSGAGDVPAISYEPTGGASATGYVITIEVPDRDPCVLRGGAAPPASAPDCSTR